MAVAHGAWSESHGAATGSTNETSFTWNHAGGTGIRGALVFVWCDSGTDYVTGVTYGGVAMTAVSGGRASDAAGEPGSVKAYFLKNPPTGTQAVVVSRTNNAQEMWACCASQTCASDKDLAVHEAGIVLLQGDGTYAVQSVTDGGAATNSQRYACGHSGSANLLAPGTGSTAGVDFDTGNFTCTAVHETTPGTGARNVGFSYGTSDDRAAVHLAIKETAQALTATPNGLAVSPSFGTLVGTMKATPNGLAVPTALGSPTGLLPLTATPNGIAVPVTIGGIATVTAKLTPFPLEVSNPAGAAWWTVVWKQGIEGAVAQWNGAAHYQGLTSGETNDTFANKDWWAWIDRSQTCVIRAYLEPKDTGQQWPVSLGRVLYVQHDCLMLSLVKTDGVNEWRVRLEWKKADDSGFYTVESAAGSIIPGRFHTILWWYDAAADTLNIQVDSGTPVQTTGVTAPKATNLNAWDELTFGANLLYGYPSFSGAMADWTRWSKVLTSDERAEFHNEGRRLPYSQFSASLLTSLEFHFPLDEAAGTTRYDEVGAQELWDEQAVDTLQGSGPPLEVTGRPTGKMSAVPNGLAVPVTLGSPTIVAPLSATPDGLAVPVALGSPTAKMSATPSSVGGGAGGSITRVQSKSVVAGLSGALNDPVSVGQVIIVGFGTADTGAWDDTATCADNLGNTYTKVGSAHADGLYGGTYKGYVAIFRCVVTSAGTPTITITPPADATNHGFVAVVYSGTDGTFRNFDANTAIVAGNNYAPSFSFTEPGFLFLFYMTALYDDLLGWLGGPTQIVYEPSQIHGAAEYLSPVSSPLSGFGVNVNTGGDTSTSILAAAVFAGVASGITALGSPTGKMRATPNGLAVPVTLGSPTATLQATPTGLAVPTALGEPTGSTPSAGSATPNGLAVAVTFGTLTTTGKATPNGLAVTPTFGTLSGTLRATPTALAVPTALGSPTGTLKATPDSLAVAVSFGTLVATGKAIPNGLAVPTTLGSPTGQGGTGTAYPASLAVPVTFGTLVARTTQATPNSLSVAVSFGTVNATRSAAPTSLAVPVSFGTLAVKRSIVPTGTAVPVSFGTLKGTLKATPNALAVSVTFGTLTARTTQATPNGLAVTVSFGNLTAQGGTGTAYPASVIAAASFGTLTAKTTQATPTALPVAVSFGTFTITGKITPSGLATPTTLGNLEAEMSASPAGVSVAVGLGTPSAQGAAVPAGLAVPVGTGTLTLTLKATPAGLAVPTGIGEPAALEQGTVIAGGLLVLVSFGTTKADYRRPVAHGVDPGRIVRPVPHGSIIRPSGSGQVAQPRR